MPKYCPECREENRARIAREAQYRWRQKNRDRVNLWAARWREKNRERLREYNRVKKRESRERQKEDEAGD
jgi:hypothetical protein